MNLKLQKFIKDLKQTRLTVNEKFDLRQRLFEMVQADNYIPNVYTRESSVWISVWHWFKYPKRFEMITAFLLILSLSGGTIWASQYSLPGNLLYPLKVDLNENVMRIVSKTSLVTAVNFETSIMEERLIEAEKLDKEQKLMESLKVTVGQGIADQETRVNNAVVNLISKNNKSLKNQIDNQNGVSDASSDKSIATSSGFLGENGILEADNQITSTKIDTEVKNEIMHAKDVLKNHRTIIEKIQLHDLKALNYSEGNGGGQNNKEVEN